jgi:aspartyl-tRNA(Asn)/glutamyl-tRNA(Gln) amidotransferase subunit B
LKGLKLQDIKVTPHFLRELVKLIDDGGISGKMAKDILVEMIETGKFPQEIVQQKGLSQISNSEEIEKIVDKVIEENTKSVSDFKNGKEKAIIFLVGQVMVKTKGKANPKMVNESLRRKLSKGG